jgi:hypothetical protein
MDRHIVPYEGLAGLIYAIEQFNESLLLSFRDCLSDGFALCVALTDEIAIRGIEQFEPVFGSAERSEEGRSLLEEISQTLGFAFELMLGENALGGLCADDQRGFDVSGRVADRAVSISPVDILEFAVAKDRHELIFVPTGLATRHDGFDLRPDDRPDFLPAFPAGLTERARVFVFADAGSIGVVVELHEVITPPEKHGMPRCQHGVNDNEQSFGPGINGTNGCAVPREGPRKVGHFPGAEDLLQTHVVVRLRGNNLIWSQRLHHSRISCVAF